MSSKPPSKLDQAMDSLAASVAKRIEDGCLLGLGSGSAVARFAKSLGARVEREKIRVSIVPSSMQAWILAKENGLGLAQDSAHCPSSLDIAVDGADQISLDSRSMVKGGGGALLREKIILSSSKLAYILVDNSKVAPRLERSIPVEVVQFAVESVAEKIKTQDAVPELRKLDKGYPFFTESGNVVLDCKFSKPIKDPVAMELAIKRIPGVVEAGIFNCRVDKFYVGAQDGSFSSH